MSISVHVELRARSVKFTWKCFICEFETESQDEAIYHAEITKHCLEAQEVDSDAE